MSARSSRCLLLVEDDPLVRDTVALMLEDEGFEVVEAANVQGALHLMRAGLETPLMVTDVDLGPGPSGADLADEMRRARPDLAIIFITGRVASLKDRVLGPNEAVLPKPFESRTLSQMVRAMTGLSVPGPA